MNDYMQETFKELKDYEASLKGVEAERANALWESDKAAWYGQQDGEQKWAYDSPDAPRVKWLKSETVTVEELATFFTPLTEERSSETTKTELEG